MMLSTASTFWERPRQAVNGSPLRSNVQPSCHVSRCSNEFIVNVTIESQIVPERMVRRAVSEESVESETEGLVLWVPQAKKLL